MMVKIALLNNCTIETIANSVGYKIQDLINHIKKSKDTELKNAYNNYLEKAKNKKWAALSEVLSYLI